MINPSIRCWYNLKLDKPVFKKGWVRPTPTESSHIWVDEANNVYDKQWLIYAQKELGLPLGMNLIFYNDPTVDRPHGHVDVSINKFKDVATQHCAINWIEGGAGSEMVWYEPKPDAEEIKLCYTEAGVPFKQWPLSSLEETQSTHLTGVTLVRTDVPHNIIMGNEERWAYSVRPRWDVNHEWELIVRYLYQRNVIY